jgi:hypothetical protein
MALFQADYQMVVTKFIAVRYTNYMRPKVVNTEDLVGNRDFGSGLGEVDRSTDTNVPGCVSQPGFDLDSERLIEALCSADQEARHDAAALLEREANVEMLPRLLGVLTHADPAVRHTMLVLVRNLYRTANMRRDADLRVALEADAVICALAGCLRDDHPLNVIAANVALSCIAAPKAKQHLAEWRREQGGTGSVA